MSALQLASDPWGTQGTSRVEVFVYMITNFKEFVNYPPPPTHIQRKSKHDIDLLDKHRLIGG